MIINNFNIDISEMPSVETTRKISVYGEKGAKFEIIALQSGTLKYYNFESREFEDGHNGANSSLMITLDRKRYNNSIVFPEGAGDYVVKIIAAEGTTIQNVKSNVISRNITKQAASTVITFTADQPTNGYATVPTTTATGSAGSSTTTNFNWDITGASRDSYGFGFRLTDVTLTEKLWYTKVTTDVDGAISSAKRLYVDSLTGIGVGTTLVSGTGLSGTPYVTAIDTSTNQISLSSVQTISDGVTLTFHAKGSVAIKEAIGLDLSFTSPIAEVTPATLTKTVRANVSSSTSVTLTDTLGIAGGNHVTYTGVGVNNSSANAVTSVTEDYDGTDGDGVVVVQLAQTLTAGSVLTFEGSSHVVNVTGDIAINSFTSDNQTVYLDIDSILTVGTAS